jgi:hypothetical protein
VRVKLAGHLIETTVVGSVDLTGLPIVINHNTGQIGCRFVFDFTQAAPGPLTMNVPPTSSGTG